MEKLTSTSPALSKQEAERLALRADREAQEESTEHGKEVSVKDFQSLHREKARQLMMHPGTDGVAHVGEPLVSDQHVDTAPGMEETKQQVDEAVDDLSRQREKAFSTVRNVKLKKLPGNTAGLQDDNDRSITMDISLVDPDANAEAREEFLRHERRHREQAIPPKDTGTPRTGDAKVDELLALGEEEYREEDAMREAGYRHTSQKYRTDYLEPVNHVARYLNERGQRGDELVRNAGYRGELQAVRTALVRAHVRERILEDFRQ